jgi:hypothetical protein
VLIRTRDEEVAKLREDNHEMFKDLKEYAEKEETIMAELNDHKTRRLELETMNEDLREKTQN